MSLTSPIVIYVSCGTLLAVEAKATWLRLNYRTNLADVSSVSVELLGCQILVFICNTYLWLQKRHFVFTIRVKTEP